MKSRSISVFKIVFIAVMAAIVCAVTFFRFPFLGSKVHFANAMCLLSGLLFGPVSGGLAAGLGSALYDGLFGGYDIIETLVTFVSKFLMAYICAVIAQTHRGEQKKLRIAIGCITGAGSYVALYMLKTFVKQWLINSGGDLGVSDVMEIAGVTMLSKLPASLINAVFGVLASVLLYSTLYLALKKANLLEKLR